MKIDAWIILSDLQVPYEDVHSLAAVEKYMAAHKWAGYIQIGDFLDFDSISSFNQHLPRKTRNSFISNDIDRANKILDRHQAIVRRRNPEAKFVLLEGNHEERVERFLDQNPMFEGLLDVPKLLRLGERDIKWIKAWTNGETYSVGKARFTHGNYTNQYHAKKMVDAEDRSIFYGHTHDMMCIPKSKRDKTELHIGQSIGCLCEIEQSYMKGKPSNWQQGFMVLFLMPNGNYTYYTPRIFDHKFIGPDQILYEG